MKRKGMFLGTLLMLALSLNVCANAADYSFDGIASAEYYPSTSYESIYGSRYNYGGANVIDYQYPELPFGVVSTTSVGVMEKVRLPGQIAPSGIINVDVSGGGSVYAVPGTYSGSTVTPTPTIYQPTAFTSVDDMKRSDGSIGTVKIPSLDISMKVFEGETDSSIIRSRWLGRRTTDCIGLVKGYGWLDADTLTIRYGTNAMPDYGADRMYQDAQERGAEHGTLDSLPEIPGLVLWKSGHTGVYIGGGYAIEAMGTSKGVVKTEVAGRGWQAWYKIPYIDYD